MIALVLSSIELDKDSEPQLYCCGENRYGILGIKPENYQVTS